MPGLDKFPTAAIGSILKSQGRDPQITDEFIDSLLYTQYEDRQAFSILALIAPHLDYKNGNFHKDHLHPESAFSKARLLKAGMGTEDLDFYSDKTHWNSILNIALLDGPENSSKK